MKKLRFILVFMLIVLLCVPLISACAGKTGVTRLEFLSTDDGNAYRVRVKFGSYANGIVELPSTHNEKPVTAIEQGGFRGATHFIAVTVPESIKTIGRRTFYNCEALTVIMKGTVPPTQNESFSGGYPGPVKAIIVPDSAVDAYKEAWSEYKNRIYSDNLIVENKFLIVDGILVSYFSDEELITVPDSVTKTGGSAFINNDFIREISFHKDVTEISGLSGLINIEKINIREDNERYASVNGMLFNKSKTSCLYIPRKLGGDIVLPDGFVPITGPSHNYTNHYGKDSLYFADTLITSISFPQGYTNIFPNLLKGCKNLTSVTLPDDLGIIGANAFSGCENLTVINIPASVKTIGAKAFSGCDKLEIRVPFAESEKPTDWAKDWNGGSKVVWNAK